MNNLTKHVQPTSWAEATQLAKDISKSDLVPQNYRGKPEQILCAIQYGAEIGFSPFQALQSIVIISGKASLSGDAMLALVSARSDCEGVSETLEGAGNDRRAVCEIRRRGWKPTVCTFSVADATKAGLWNNSVVWKKYPDRMLQMRARGFAVRNAFQDALKGFISSEEAQDYPTKNSAPRAEATASNKIEINASDSSDADESPSSPVPSVAEPIEVVVVDKVVEEDEDDIPYEEEIPQDIEEIPQVPLITPQQRSGLENFVLAHGLDLDELDNYTKEIGYAEVNHIPRDMVSEVVKGLVEFAKGKGVAHG